MDWLDSVISGSPNPERAVVERYSHRLVGLARRQLPDRLRARIDPEDVVQSVYRSFFRRLEQGKFEFQQSDDIWLLLAAMTFHKARNAVRFHKRQQRNSYREVRFQSSSTDAGTGDLADPAPQPEDVVVMFECLERLLAQIPDHYHQIVVLRMEAFSIAEIADRVHLSQRTVLRVLARIRTMAAEQLEVET